MSKLCRRKAPEGNFSNKVSYDLQCLVSFDSLLQRIKEAKGLLTDVEQSLIDACLDVDNEYLLKARK